jgi:sarcosine oxidase subunit gamma
MSNVNAKVRPDTPLAHIQFQSDKKGGVKFQELGFYGHLTLRGNSGDAGFVSSVEAVLGLSLPVKALSSASSADVSIHWISPNEWLIISAKGDEAELEASLRAKLTGHFSVVDVSGGQTVFELSGDDVVSLMKKSCGYDIEAELPQGKTVTTHFAKASVVMSRVDEHCFRMVVRRSFADYVWRWIEDATQEFGLVIKL